MTKKTLLKNVFWQGIHDGVAFALGFAFYSVIGRKLGKTGLGSYNFVVSTLLIVFVLIDLGINSHLLRHWSTSAIDKHKDLVIALVTKSLSLLIFLSLSSLYFVFFDSKLLEIFVYAALYLTLELPLYLLQTLARSQNNFSQSTLTGLIDRGFFQGLGILWLWSGGSLSHVFLLGSLGRVISLAILIPQLHPFKWYKPQIRDISALLTLSFPLFLVAVFSNIYLRVDVMLIRKLLSLEAVGTYSAAYRITETLFLIPSLIFLSISPTVTKLYAEHSLDKLEKLREHALQALLAVSILVMMFFVSYRYEIIDFVYGSQFEASALLLAVLSLSIPFFFMNGLFMAFVYANHHEKKLLKFYVIITICNIVLNTLTLQKFGLIAAAMNTVITEGLLSLFLFTSHGWKFPVMNILKMIVCALPFVWLLSWFHPPLIVSLALAGTSYLLFLTLLGQVPIKLIQETYQSFLATKNKV